MERLTQVASDALKIAHQDEMIEELLAASTSNLRRCHEAESALAEARGENRALLSAVVVLAALLIAVLVAAAK